MTLRLGAIPLLALPAVALDTETTGLDVRKARLIEYGVIPINDGRLERELGLVTLVNCGEPIPAASTAVHGIADADIREAPAYAAMAEVINQSLADKVVIGHTIGFDLALLEREHRRVGLVFTRPVALDVRLLAQIVAPNLPDHSLEALAAWLGVTADNRHRAFGDAQTAGLIFLALLPKLREIGLRTLGETLSACRQFGDRGGMQASPVDWSLEDANQSLIRASETFGIGARIDSYPYRHIVRDVMSSSPVRMDSASRVSEALAVMTGRRFSSVLVGGDLARTLDVGILTERDIMRALAIHGADALALPIGPLASRPLVTVPEDARLYRAIGRMANRNLRHLVATDMAGEITGILTTRDLLRLRASAAIALGDELDSATNVPALAKAWARLPAMAEALLAEEVSGRDIAAVIAQEIGALTRRAAILAEAELVAGGEGAAPCRYTILVLGSAGRGESLLAMDQDNALIFESGEPDGPEDRWFAKLGTRMAGMLDEVGVPLCKGGVMASQPEFRGSAALWRGRIRHWIGRSRPEDLLAVDIFFDFRAVHGALDLAQHLWSEAWAAVQHETAFLKLLANEVEEGAAPVGFFGKLKLDGDGRIDLKRHGLKRLVATARVLALKHNIARHATHDRLKNIQDVVQAGQNELVRFDADHALLLEAILRQQLEDIRLGKPPTNRVSPKILDVAGRDALTRALSHQSDMADFLRGQLSD